MNEKRIEALNFYKAAGALLVILIHVTATPVTTLPEGASFWAVFFINRLAKPAVPMFIFASGMALYFSYRNKSFHYGSFLWRRATKIVIPYVLWSALYYAYFIHQGVYTFTWSFFWIQTISGRMMYHFYFVVAILQFYLLFGVLRELVQRMRASVLLPIAVVVNILSYSMVPELWVHRSFLSSLVYFLAGCYFAKDYEKAVIWLKRWSKALLPVFLLSGFAYCCMFYREIWQNELYLEQKWILNYLYFPYCITGLLLYYGALNSWCVRAGAWTCSLMNSLNAGSYYIYLAHPFGLILASQLAAAYGVTGALRSMACQLLFVAVIIIPICVAYSRIKKHMFLKKSA